MTKVKIYSIDYIRKATTFEIGFFEDDAFKDKTNIHLPPFLF